MDRRSFLRNLLGAAAAPYVPAKSFFFAPAMGWKPIPAITLPFYWDNPATKFNPDSGIYPMGTGVVISPIIYHIMKDGIYENLCGRLTKISEECVGEVNLSKLQEHARLHGAVLPGERTARPSTSQPRSRRT